MTLATILLTMAAGAVAGSFGALLGIGGGVFLVPFLNSVMGLDFKTAAAVSLITVIATSSAVSARASGQQLINLRLGMLLEVASAAGGSAAGMLFHVVPERALIVLFALVSGTIALLMLARIDRRNVIFDSTLDPGLLGGRFVDADTQQEVVSRVKRLPLGMGVSFLAGSVSALLGIGGGVLKVPVLNSWCGIPMRAAAATSGLMIGVTAVASVPIQYASGYIPAPLAAAAVIGVLFGAQGGFLVSGRAKARWLKILMSAVLATVSLIYLMRVL
jgi:uncharacterized membrane protein YfcA